MSDYRNNLQVLIYGKREEISQIQNEMEIMRSKLNLKVIELSILESAFNTPINSVSDACREEICRCFKEMNINLLD